MIICSRHKQLLHSNTQRKGQNFSLILYYILSTSKDVSNKRYSFNEIQKFVLMLHSISVSEKSTKLRFRFHAYENYTGTTWSKIKFLAPMMTMTGTIKFNWDSPSNCGRGRMDDMFASYNLRNCRHTWQWIGHPLLSPFHKPLSLSRSKLRNTYLALALCALNKKRLTALHFGNGSRFSTAYQVVVIG
jgi:hypothetical protein